MSVDRRQLGRPKLKEGVKRNHCLSLRVNSEELEVLKLAARKAELTFSDWARDALMLVFIMDEDYRDCEDRLSGSR